LLIDQQILVARQPVRLRDQIPQAGIAIGRQRDRLQRIAGLDCRFRRSRPGIPI
jgi:hypothetical protein